MILLAFYALAVRKMLMYDSELPVRLLLVPGCMFCFYYISSVSATKYNMIVNSVCYGTILIPLSRLLVYIYSIVYTLTSVV